MSELISINEARKILGKEHEHLTDEQVQELVSNLHVIAKGALKMGRDKAMKEREDRRHLMELASFLYSRYLFDKANKA